MSDLTRNAAGTGEMVSAPANRRSATRWSVLIFLCGVLVGGSVSLIGMNYFLSYRFQHPEQMFLRIVDRMQGGLKLSVEQRAKVIEIFQKKHTEIDTMFNQEIKPKLEAQFDGLRD